MVEHSNVHVTWDRVGSGCSKNSIAGWADKYLLTVSPLITSAFGIEDRSRDYYYYTKKLLTTV